jgi:diguanylate cyclase (GGDEF)-like protein
MAETIQLEKSILAALKNSDDWRTLELASLRNLLREINSSVAAASISLLTDAILNLSAEGLLSVQKQDYTAHPVPFDPQRRNDETYRSAFFTRDSFQLRLTHEGRRTLGFLPPEKASDDHFDDKIPTLYRAKYFEPDLEGAVKEAGERGEPLSLLMLDLDHFKTVNDTHGHPIGDEVLRGCGEIVAKHVRGKGKAYRYGGEEFTVFLPNFGLNEGIAIAEETRRSIEAAVVSSRNLHITASVGLACFPEHATVASELIKRADEAMYRAKALGRNLVRVSGESENIQSPTREVARREPTPGGLSDEEVRDIRKTYFRGGRPECPRDGAILEIRKFETMAQRTPTLLVRCPLCGLSQITEGSS